MGFADAFVTPQIEDLRARILNHPLWQGIATGAVSRRTLQIFALQDYWLVREAYRLDALAVAAAPDLALQEHLLAKLQPKIGGHRLLVHFGEALGLDQTAFDEVEPLAGCMALTNFFYWMLAYGTPGEKLAAVGASEAIFVELCRMVGPNLIRNYGLSAAEVEFFTAHDVLGDKIAPIEDELLSHYATTEQHIRLIGRAIRLSHQFELMFYDTVLQA